MNPEEYKPSGQHTTPGIPAANLPNHPSQPGHPNYPPQKDQHVQPPPAPMAYPSLPGMAISDEEHNRLKASREAREKKYAELVKLAAEIGCTVSGFPSVRVPHQPSKYALLDGRPSGLTLEQEAENERFLDDTERNTLHREEEIKKAAEAAERDKQQKEKEVARFKERTANKGTGRG